MEGVICIAKGLDGEEIRVVQLDGKVYSLRDGTQPDLRGYSLTPVTASVFDLSEVDFSLLTHAWSDSAREAATAARAGTKSAKTGSQPSRYERAKTEADKYGRWADIHGGFVAHSFASASHVRAMSAAKKAGDTKAVEYHCERALHYNTQAGKALASGK